MTARTLVRAVPGDAIVPLAYHIHNKYTNIITKKEKERQIRTELFGRVDFTHGTTSTSRNKHIIVVGHGSICLSHHCVELGRLFGSARLVDETRQAALFGDSIVEPNLNDGAAFAVVEIEVATEEAAAVVFLDVEVVHGDLLGVVAGETGGVVVVVVVAVVLVYNVRPCM